MPFYLVSTIFHFLSLLISSSALLISPPASPVYLGSTVRVTWTFTPQDPPSFYLMAQCEGTLTTPHVNATTSAGQLFVRLPSFLDFWLSIPCAVLGKAHKTDQLLSRSKPFDLILHDPSNVQSIHPATSFRIVSPSPSSPTSLSTVTFSQNSAGNTVDLSSVLLPTPIKKEISVTFSTVAPASTTSSSAKSSINTNEATSAPKKPSLAIIIGPPVAGLVLVCVLAAFLIICRHRRRRHRSASLEVVPPTPFALYATPGNNSGIVVDSRLRSDASSTTDLIGVDEGTIGGTRVREMFQLLSERIMALEAQQSRIATGEVSDQGEVIDQLRPPPYYWQADGEVPLLQSHPHLPQAIATRVNEEAVGN